MPIKNGLFEYGFCMERKDQSIFEEASAEEAEFGCENEGGVFQIVVHDRALDEISISCLGAEFGLRCFLVCWQGPS